jgi:hypothetical protein
MRKEKHGQYERWICKNKKTCRKTKGALVRILTNFKLSLQQFIQVIFNPFVIQIVIKIMYFWSRRLMIHINQLELTRMIGV